MTYYDFNSFGYIRHLKEYIKIIYPLFTRNNANRTIISVGSGDGRREKQLLEKFGTPIIGIDPIIDKDIKFYQKPEYKNIEELINKKQNIIANCDIILFWPSPNDTGNDYDYKAIKDLQPTQIFIVYASCGASGGTLLQSRINYLFDNENIQYSNMKKSQRDDKFIYNIIAHYRKIITKDYFGVPDDVSYDILLLSKFSKITYDQDIINKLPDSSKTGENNCIIS